MRSLSHPAPLFLAQAGLWEVTMARAFWKEIRGDLEEICGAVCEDPGSLPQGICDLDRAFGEGYDALVEEIVQCMRPGEVVEALHILYQYLSRLRRAWEAEGWLRKGTAFTISLNDIVKGYLMYRKYPKHHIAGFVRDWAQSKYR